MNKFSQFKKEKSTRLIVLHFPLFEQIEIVEIKISELIIILTLNLQYIINLPKCFLLFYFYSVNCDNVRSLVDHQRRLIWWSWTTNSKRQRFIFPSSIIFTTHFRSSCHDSSISPRFPIERVSESIDFFFPNQFEGK